MESKKNDTNELIYKKETRLTDIENKLVVTRGERGKERGMVRVGD